MDPTKPVSETTENPTLNPQGKPPQGKQPNVGRGELNRGDEEQYERDESRGKPRRRSMATQDSDAESGRYTKAVDAIAAATKKLTESGVGGGEAGKLALEIYKACGE